MRAEVWAGTETASPAPSRGHSNGEAVVLVPKEGLVLWRNELCCGSSGSPQSNRKISQSNERESVPHEKFAVKLEVWHPH